MSYSRTQNPSFSRTRRGRGVAATRGTRGTGTSAAVNGAATRGTGAASFRSNPYDIHGNVMNTQTSQSSFESEGLNADRYVEEGRSGTRVDIHEGRLDAQEGRLGYHEGRSGVHEGRLEVHGRSGIHEGSPGVHNERTMQHQGAHHSMAPDPSRNSRLKKNAEEEEARYAEYKEMKREKIAQELTHQPPMAVGGRIHTLKEIDELRKKEEIRQQKEARFAAIRSRQKREDYRQKEREKEEEEIRQRKALQREKAVRAEDKKKQKLEVDLEELRRKRLARFT